MGPEISTKLISTTPTDGDGQSYSSPQVVVVFTLEIPTRKLRRAKDEERKPRSPRWKNGSFLGEEFKGM